MKHLLVCALMVLGFNYQAFAQTADSVETTTTETTTTTTTPPETTSPSAQGTTTGSQQAAGTQTDSRENRWGLKKAGAYIEPMLIYAQNSSDVAQDINPGADTTGDVRDTAFGARLGLHLGEIFFLAADGRYGTSTFNNTFYEDADATGFNYGATAGLQTPFYGVRLWGTYILGGEFDPEAGAANTDVAFTEGTGYRLGTGIHVGAISLNLEYQTLTYGDVDVETAGAIPAGVAANDLDVTQSGYAFSVGFPFEL